MNVIDFFKEISKIPRESGNEKQIAEYLCNFAKKRNLKYYIDKKNNVIIKKNVCKGEPLILQAHTDMVCEKESNKKFDFEKDSIEVVEENGYLTAKGTTLGADNGIGVAQILYILDSDIKCNIEGVFTTSEETTMSGAFGLDTSRLKGNLLLNLDGFEEDTIIIESAAFFDIVMKLNYNKSRSDRSEYSNRYKIKVFGLKGGHSGFDINKNRGNSSIILANLLTGIDEFEIETFEGGTKFNVIPSEAETIIRTNINENQLKEIIKKEKEKINYNGLKVETITLEESNQKVLSKDNSKKFIESIKKFPHGVVNKNENGEITTSINLGVVSLKENVFKVGMRSSRKAEEEKCLEMLKKYSNESNIEFNVIGHQPGFETNKKDKIVKLLEEAFYDIEGNKAKKLKIEAVHITVEIGIIKEKMPNIQVAIISPNIQGAHTTQEKVEIESINRTTKWLENFIKKWAERC